MPMKFLTKHTVEQDVMELALERTRHAYDLYDHIAVSFSGGKDSSCVLNIALQVARERDRLPLRVIFFDEEAIPMQTIEYVERLAENPDIAMEIYCVPVQQRNACSRKEPWWWPWAPEDEAKWCRPLPKNAIRTIPGFPMEPPSARLSIPETSALLFPPQLGQVGMLMGIRADESIIRYRAVARRTADLDNYIIQPGSWQSGPGWKNVAKVYPIYDWTTTDVWTAPAKFGWDTNKAYDAMEMAGMPHDAQRCSPAYGEEPMRGLWIFAHCFPEVWDKMAERVPGAATAARYARTELYSYGVVPEPRPDQTWQQFIAELIAKHAPEQQKDIAARIKTWITTHFSHTHEPIMPRSPHPITGVSWARLAMIATRGDFKDRKQLQPGNDPQTRARLQAAYDAEREALEKGMR